MYCYRCHHVFTEGEEPVYAVIPGRYSPAPTCRDDRVCVLLVSPRMKRVQAIASRYVKGTM